MRDYRWRIDIKVIFLAHFGQWNKNFDRKWVFYCIGDYLGVKRRGQCLRFNEKANQFGVLSNSIFFIVLLSSKLFKPYNNDITNLTELTFNYFWGIRFRARLLLSVMIEMSRFVKIAWIIFFKSFFRSVLYHIIQYPIKSQALLTVSIIKIGVRLLSKVWILLIGDYRVINDHDKLILRI